MATKRPAGDAASSSGAAPPKKKGTGCMEPVQIGPVASLEEMDKKVLQFQNKKLAERLEQRRLMEDDLRKRIEQLEQRQATDDAVLMIINRYWNQLDEDVRVLLQRFDAEAADENENKNENGATTSFLAQLSSWDQQEMEQKQGQRVEFSKRAIGKLLQAYDRLLQRHERLVLSINLKSNDEDKSSDAESDSKEEKCKEDGEMEIEEKKEKEESPGLDEVVKKEVVEALSENKRLHDLVTQLHERHHINTLKSTEMEEKLTRAETEIAELRNKIDDLEYDQEHSKEQVFKLEKRCIDVVQQLKMQSDIVKVGDGPSIAKSQVSDSWIRESLSELEEVRELAVNRLQELEELQAKHQLTVRELEQLRMDLKTLPECVIVETTEYKCLQSQFSVLYNECMQIKTQLEENRQLLQTSKNVHLRQIEQMESDELACQKNLRAEVINLEDTLAQCRKEYEMLRIEFEQTLAASEQTGPINREMRNLITSLQNHNHQLKVEIARYKKKLKECHTELSKLRTERASTAFQPSSSTLVKNEPKDGVEVQLEETKPAEVKEETSPIEIIPDEPIIIKEEEKEESETDKGKSESETIKDLKSQLKKANDSQKELKLLLDMYKSAPKEQKDKVKLMCAEKKAKQEIEELKNHIKKMQEAEKKEKRKLADDDAIKKIRKLEEQISELQKQLSAQKQEEEALLSEMEVTGQAFEDMQEQNVRLIQQLREKDDANFKLMSERIKSNQIQKLLKEEKDILEEQVTTVHSQVEAQNVVVRKLEEKERLLQNNLATVEKELSLRQQAMEMHKRKAIESAQTAADLKLHLDKYQSQLKEAQTAVSEKVATLEREAYKSKRVNEEVASLRKKLERHKKMEMAETADEVLMEEIREYKEQLTCPSCKVKRKDAVLTKCFHVFCLECLKTRYETRQRKCPKCNAAFGANDFHRIYIG